MYKSLVAALIVLCSTSMFAQEKVRLNLKEGLWETTHTMNMGGMPPIPADVLAKMTPEQQARMTAMMGERGMGKPSTSTEKSCITKEKLEKSTLFDDKRKDCTHTVVSSSATHYEVKFKCEHDKMNSEGTMVVDAINSESAKGSVHVASVAATATSGGHPMNVDFSFTTRYLGPACGDVK